jgi:polyphosphate glucokinase
MSAQAAGAAGTTATATGTTATGTSATDAKSGPFTLAIDIGGTGLKASVLDASGRPVVDRARRPTTYPSPPAKLVADLVTLVEALPAYDRVSVGFPGMVRDGRVLSAPHFVTAKGPGSKVLPELVDAWAKVDLAAALGEALERPVRVVNDADLQGCAVVKGHGLELVVTLGTGFGTAVFLHGHLAPHLEISQHPLRKDRTYNQELGDAARRRLGAKRWSKRVSAALRTLDALMFYDALFVGGGNARHLTVDLGPKATLIDNQAGIVGGIKLWERRIN